MFTTSVLSISLPGDMYGPSCLHFLAFFFVLVLFLHLPQAHAKRIIFTAAHGAASHTKGMYPLASRLAEDPTNQVTVLQLRKVPSQNAVAPAGSNVTDRYFDSPLRSGESEASFVLPTEMQWGHWTLGGWQMATYWEMFGANICASILEDEGRRMDFFRMIRDEGPIDMVVVDDVCSPCGMLLALEAKRLYNASVINFGTTILMPQSQQSRGIPIHKTLSPSIFKPIMGLYDHRSFAQRLHNFVDRVDFDLIESAIDYRVPRWLGMPENRRVVPSRFVRDSPDLLFASLSPMLEFTKPRTNDVIELDVNCPAKEDLSEKFRRFVEDPRSKGTILLAMGHFADWDNAPRAAFDSFFEAFSNLTDYRIVWQYAHNKETKMRKQPPPNVLMDEWVPQAALLYHPKTKAFISHCGGKSLRETICGGVPVVTMPMFAEQYRNAAVAHKKRIATFLDKTSLSPSIVLESLTTILDDPSYDRRAKSLQRQLEDQIMKPTDLGKFWVDFLFRHESSSVRGFFSISNKRLSILAKDNVDLTIGILIGIVVAASLVC